MTQLDLAKTTKRCSYVRPSLLALTAFLAATSLTPATAHADGVDPAQIQALQEQIKQLQSEIDGLVANQVKASKKLSSITPAKGSVVVSSPGKGQLKIGGVTVSLGGYVEADAIYRSKAQQSDLNTSLKGVPFGNAIGSRQSEFRETARATRLSIGLKGKADAHTTISAYVEGDFLGTSGTTANTNATNSFSPRLRQAWAGYERSDLGLHIYGGQSFSLVTQETVGMSPGKEAAMGWIDSATTVGYVNIRQPGLRIVKDFSNKYFLGISFENPTLLGVTAAGLAAPANVTFAGTQTLGGVAAVSDDVAPDVIVKGAADTSFGHYEAFGITRFLRSREGSTAAIQGHSTIKTALGGGVSAFDSIIPKTLDVQGNFIYGRGVNRYSAAQLGDVTFTPAGGLVLLPSFVAQVGATYHALPTLDLYTVAGVEMIQSGGAKSLFAPGLAGSTATTGCYVYGGTCGVAVKQVDELSAGSWWSFYKGAAGTFQTGFQYSYLRNEALRGSTGLTPHAAENMVFVSLRYSPFK